MPNQLVRGAQSIRPPPNKALNAPSFVAVHRARVQRGLRGEVASFFAFIRSCEVIAQIFRCIPLYCHDGNGRQMCFSVGNVCNGCRGSCRQSLSGITYKSVYSLWRSSWRRSNNPRRPPVHNGTRTE